ncbi:hypothetical protein SLITO_v1c07000 [Spiroplasma litorale]|uniref:Lipoprotein n=1 Tax=Spiroplasma litorale TaxID=216942 RepID=A0A0K1W2M0_9MOLU|nr:lipoprotein [Spiroplasma litorale]AKX34327.1 hypothetical protein SLITO_v1c07000 [Spiroplasma litorale]
MKKLLSIFAATGLVTTTGATVVSCGNKDEEVENMTLAEGKNDSDVVNYLADKSKTQISKNANNENSNDWKPLQIEDNKLSVDYENFNTNEWYDTEYFKIGTISGSLVLIEDGTNTNYFGSMRDYFNEIKTLENSFDNVEGKDNVMTVKLYYFTVKGLKGNSIFDLRVISVEGTYDFNEEKYITGPIVKNEFLKRIKIS